MCGGVDKVLNTHTCGIYNPLMRFLVAVERAYNVDNVLSLVYCSEF
jgi:hypothetical protein